jgi:hypothetical protein
MQCSNKLKQIGLAIHNFENVHNVIPPFGTGVPECAPECHPDPGTGTDRLIEGDYSPFVILLPFIEQSAKYDAMSVSFLGSQNRGIGGSVARTNFLPNTPPGHTRNASDQILVTADDMEPFCGTISDLLCPSDAIGMNTIGAEISGAASPDNSDWMPSSSEQKTLSNYCFSTGDYVRRNQYAFDGPGGGIAGQREDRSPFKYVLGIARIAAAKKFSEVSDGLSNTVFVSERGICDRSLAAGYSKNATGGGSIRGSIAMEVSGFANSTPYGAAPVANLLATAAGRNYNNTTRSWARGEKSKTSYWSRNANMAFFYGTMSVQFQTIIAPNGPSGSPTNDGGSTTTLVLATANSYHSGGVNAARGDGSVMFVSESIPAGTSGDAAAAVPQGASPYGIWGAFGSIDGEEAVAMP